jgi:hypothetical protein
MSHLTNPSIHESNRTPKQLFHVKREMEAHEAKLKEARQALEGVRFDI